jgi:hypothetical protein
MLSRLALGLCLVLVGCAVTTITPLRVVRDANDRALPWAIGGTYDTLNGRVAITADGTAVANGSFGALDTELRVAGSDQGYTIAALCQRVRDSSAHFGSTSVKCEVSVADRSIAATVRNVQLGPDVDREALGSSLYDVPAPTITGYDAATGQITVTIDGTVAAEGTFPPTAAEVQLQGTHQNHKVTALCVKAQASGMSHDNVRCTVTEDEPVAEAAGTMMSQPATEQAAPAPAAPQPATKQPSAARAALRPCGGPQCIHIEPQTSRLASGPDTAWVIAGDYDSLTSRLTLTINGAPVVQGRFGFLDSELQIENEYEGRKISASCMKAHGGSVASSVLKCTVFVDRQRDVVLQKEF